MRIRKTEKEILKQQGWPDDEIEQIQEAANCTKYDYNGEKIGVKKAIEILGRETWISGLCRSAFHWTATCGRVGFDSSKIFKDIYK